MRHLLVLLSGLALAPSSQQEAGPEPEADRRGLILRAEGVFDGYTLFAPLRSKTMRLIDLDGNVVHAWHTANAGYAVLLEPLILEQNVLSANELERLLRLTASPGFSGISNTLFLARGRKG